MFSILKLILTIASLASTAMTSAFALVARDAPLICTESMIPVTISAENIIIPPTDPLTYTNISGSFSIGARYCEPHANAATDSRSRHCNMLQILVHELTYTRNYWSGGGAPGEGYDGDAYSWIAYAAVQGYPTLSIDRLCNGLSSHPNATTVCQIAANVEVMNQIVLLARAGTLPTPAAARVFTEIIYVGHSFGSFVGNHYTAKYPNDTDAAILTGWNDNINLSVVLAAFDPVFIPAAIVDPARFGNLSDGYLEVDNFTVFKEVFYGGEYDPNLAALDYNLTATGAFGELTDVGVEAFVSSPAYVKPVFAMVGQGDFILCQNPDGTIECPDAASIVEHSASLYSNAAVFDAFIVPYAGHCRIFHEHAKDGSFAAHAWLSQQGF